jgi:hypothetical protein
MDNMMHVPTGCAIADAANDALYARIHYTADPHKRPPHYDVPKRRRADGVREWDRQMEMKEDVYDGLPVFADYIDAVSCPDRLMADPLEPLSGSTFYGGWDCGQTLIPAFVLLELTARLQIRSLYEVVSAGGESMETFAPRVAMECMSIIPKQWDSVEHWGDATVVTRSGSNLETAQMVAKRVAGITIRQASNVWAGRYAAVSWLVRDMIDDTEPRFLIDPNGCPTLRAGFQGAYCWATSKSGDDKGPGVVLNMPKKNSYSHIHDGLQYPAMVLKALIEGRTVKKNTKWKSQRGHLT